MSDSDTGDFSDGGPQPRSGAIGVGDTGWQAGDFLNGQGLLGMVAPVGHYMIPDQLRLGWSKAGPNLRWAGKSQIFTYQDPSADFPPAAPITSVSPIDSCIDECLHWLDRRSPQHWQFQRCLSECRERNGLFLR